jgi:hypothetical protein
MQLFGTLRLMDFYLTKKTKNNANSLNSTSIVEKKMGFLKTCCHIFTS